MKNRFPSDLLLVVFGPIFVTVIALSVASLIYRAGEFGHGWAIFALVVVFIITLIFLIGRLVHLLRWRRHTSASSSNVGDKSTPTI